MTKPITIYTDNIEYEVLIEASGVPIYAAADISNIHLNRKIALDAQATFAGGALTRPMLQEIARAAIKDLNESKSIVNQAVLWNNILYRCTYPIDEDVALRAAACVTYMDGEPHNEMTNAMMNHKVKLFKGDDAALSFFLDMGLKLIPEYTPFCEALSPNYFVKRRQTLQQLNPSLNK